MNYAVEDIKREVRVALDQNSVSTQLIDIADVDTLLLDEVIESKIEDATRTIVRDAPNHLLEGGIHFGDSISWRSQVGVGAGSILLPNDFLRLVCFQMNDWAYPATEVITESSPLYPLQSSRYPGICGNPQKPVVAIVAHSAGLMLEFYSCAAGKDAAIKQASYIPIPKIVSGEIAIPEKLKRAVVYYTASLVALTLGQTEMSASLSEISKDLLQ